MTNLRYFLAVMQNPGKWGKTVRLAPGADSAHNSHMAPRARKKKREIEESDIIERSVMAFLRCGDCGHEMFVAFSCKQRCKAEKDHCRAFPEVHGNPLRPRPHRGN